MLAKSKNCEELVLSNLGPEQYFGQVKSISRDHSIVAVRFSKQGETGMATLPNNILHEILNESKRMKSTIREMAQYRTKENIAEVYGHC